MDSPQRGLLNFFIRGIDCGHSLEPLYVFMIGLLDQMCMEYMKCSVLFYLPTVFYTPQILLFQQL